MVQPFIAALSDIFGRRLFLFLSVLLFTVGTLICCLANDFTQLLAGRSVQGVGGGGIIVLVLVITTDIIPLRQRPKYNVVLQLSWAAGTVSGPLIGGVIAQNTTWRWIFYINFPFCTLSLIMIPFVIKLEMKRSSFWQKVGRVDWLGGVFFIASLTSFLVAITWGGIQFPWANYRTLVPLAVGVAGLIMAVAWERWVAQQPFLRLFLFNSRSAILAYICTTLQGLLVSTLREKGFMASVNHLIAFYWALLPPVLHGVGQSDVTDDDWSFAGANHLYNAPCEYGRWVPHD